MPAPYPLQLDPILVPKVWGGRRLADFGKTLPVDQTIGESWEIADLPLSVDGGRNRIANGPCAGSTLRELITSDPAWLLGSAQPSDDGGFPLLIKFLDATENLSIQVHPTASYVAAHPDAHLKTEAWIVLDAEPGAVLYKGFARDLDPTAFAEAARSGAIVEAMHAVPAEVGSCHYLESGTCHALGAGILVAEVQTPSDTTFRIYDWGRTGRSLHLEQAAQCLDLAAVPSDPGLPPPGDRVGHLTVRRLVDSDHFLIERLDAEADGTVDLVTNDVPIILMTLHGTATVRAGGEQVVLSRGGSSILPAAATDGRIDLPAGTSVLRIAPPDPTRGLHA